MQKPNQKGFTLIEIIVVMAIFLVILGFSYFLGLDYYKAYVFRAERINLVSLLQKARAQALANINQTRHGIHLDNTGYTLFEGSTFAAGQPSNYFFSSSSLISHSGAVNIIFDQLTANTAGGQIALHDGIHPDVTITINYEGQINY